jgi:hypothetical protein
MRGVSPRRMQKAMNANRAVASSASDEGSGHSGRIDPTAESYRENSAKRSAAFWRYLAIASVIALVAIIAWLRLGRATTSLHARGSILSADLGNHDCEDTIQDSSLLSLRKVNSWNTERADLNEEGKQKQYSAKRGSEMRPLRLWCSGQRSTSCCVSAAQVAKSMTKTGENEA